MVEAPKLKKLVLSGDYKDNKKFRRLDLTGCFDIEELIIKERANIDVYSIGRLEHLKKLCIYGGNIESLKWIAQYRNLEHLEIVRSHIKDISGLENLQRLRRLDF